MAEIRLGYLNSVALLGRVVQDPDLRYTPKGTAVLGFRMAVNRRYRVGEEWRDDTSYFDVNVWAQQAERLGETMKKGSAVLVEGELRQRSYETKTGDKRSVVEIHARRVQVLDKWDSQRRGDSEGSDDQGDQPDQGSDQLDDIPF
ncbi:single-stranded DNA-binding protein [candidate division WOR-3 bacterium]|nr:single-stranded DNA-binding protein [candidate division WOR-3 bacterium]